MNFISVLVGLCASAIAFLSASDAGVAAELSHFYEGKTIQIIVGYPPGGGYDLLSRALSRHLGRHILGDPTIVTQNMPGAGSRIAAQYIYNVAPQDGTYIGIVSQYLPLAHIMESDRSFISSKFNWLGSLGQGGNNIMFAWGKTAIKSIEDLKKRQLIVASAGPQTNTEYYPAILNNLFGTKFKSIAGYSGSGDVLLAVERGELQGMASVDWPGLMRSRPQWITQKKINILLQIGPSRQKELPDVPLMTDLAQNPREQRLLEIVSSGVEIGRPYFVGPQVPSDRVQILRRALDETERDPAFLADVQKAALSIDPISGSELQGLVEQSTDLSPTLLSELKRALDTDTLGR